jgi:cytochrome c biogenesis protein
MPDGSVQHQTDVFLPSDATTLLSEGAFSLDGAQFGKNAGKQDIDISGLFAPTPVDEGNGKIGSTSPQVNDPELSIFVYEGDLNGSGLPHSVYTIDTSKMRKIGTANLRVGQTKQLPDGVAVTFDGWKPWASLQVSHDPAQGYLLISALAMVIGLLASLGVRRRRVWLRVSPGADGDSGSPTVVTVGGLARSDSGNFTTEFAGLLERLRAAGAPIERVPTSVSAGKDSSE